MIDEIINIMDATEVSSIDSNTDINKELSIRLEILEEHRKNGVIQSYSIAVDGQKMYVSHSGLNPNWEPSEVLKTMLEKI